MKIEIDMKGDKKIFSHVVNEIYAAIYEKIEPYVDSNYKTVERIIKRDKTIKEKIHKVAEDVFNKALSEWKKDVMVYFNSAILNEIDCLIYDKNMGIKSLVALAKKNESLNKMMTKEAREKKNQLKELKKAAHELGYTLVKNQ